MTANPDSTETVSLRTVIHPDHPAPERIKLLVPDHWMVHADGLADAIFTLECDGGENTLQLSFASHLYQPGILPPHLLEMAEHFAARWDGALSNPGIWRRVPEGFEDAPIDETGARSPDDVVGGTVSSVEGKRFVQYTFLLQRRSIVFAIYICSNPPDPHRLKEAMDILQRIDITHSPDQ